ncbi:hypothetical protein GGE16_004349 [Rhizobium leguminosarum]|uniref:Uncharacterized protein n=2 Tax=Rhizobium/Agrobacterium group TaxID=227290 RepID=A0AAE2SZ44_RHILE|nr:MULTISPECIES: hypothetical protein [Rhizobium]MBB4292273.1 hypothetical protein [Rhizobium leguminosarum]MBB4299822.1 hypothetical protein [Rhizobium leguminosarum]MBB4309789.1 hypothetical protein [Rhizobium leguminosarum]MBB4419471.1 hypothetical protein [Rhizobium leguminosarum]MBB4434274.1 hypothetical protein [Rhizobium esperanzae]
MPEGTMDACVVANVYQREHLQILEPKGMASAILDPPPRLKGREPDDVEQDLEYSLAHRSLSFAIIWPLLPPTFKRAYRPLRMT